MNLPPRTVPYSTFARSGVKSRVSRSIPGFHIDRDHLRFLDRKAGIHLTHNQSGRA